MRDLVQRKFYIIRNPSNGISVQTKLAEGDHIEGNKIMRGIFLMGEILDTIEGNVHDAINLANEYRAVNQVIEE